MSNVWRVADLALNLCMNVPEVGLSTATKLQPNTNIEPRYNTGAIHCKQLPFFTATNVQPNSNIEPQISSHLQYRYHVYGVYASVAPRCDPTRCDAR